MPIVEYRTKPQGAVLKAYMDGWPRVSFIMGALGSGKTVQSCQKIFQAMINQKPNAQGIRPTRFIAVRNTYPDLTSTTIKDWLELYSELGRYVGGGLEPPTHHLDFDLEDGTTVKSQMIFLALDRPDAVKKLRGIQCTGFWLNEVKELPKPIVDMADLRHGRYPSMAAGQIKPTWNGMIGDTNAPDEDHWYYNLAENDRPEGWIFYRQPGGVFPVGDGFEPNPNAENLTNLPEGYYIRGMAGKSKDWIKINLANEYGYVAEGKPVYPEYVDSVHCMKDDYIPNPDLPIILGVDFGRTPACAFIQYLPAMGRYIGFDEFITEDMSAATFAPELKRYILMNYPNFQIGRSGGDPSGDQKGQATDDTPFRVLWASGLTMIQPTATNKPLIRRASIINPMKRLCMDGKPGFMIAPKAKQWRKGLMGGFCYKRVQIAGDERFHDEPDKNKYSHICFVAGTMIDTPSGKIDIRDIRAGDIVDTPLGPRKVKANGYRVAKTINAGFAVCTPDHPVWTFNGFIPAEALEYRLISKRCILWNIHWKLRRNAKQLSTRFMSLVEGGITIAQDITNRLKGTIFIEMFIGRISEKYRSTAIFTILTGTRPTTNQKIYNACTKQNTKKNTGKRTERKGLSNLTRIFSRLSLALSNGANQTKKGLAKLASKELPRYSKTATWLRKLVWNATRNTKFAQHLHQEASGVTKIAGQYLTGERVVYSIEVDDAHCYYANGVLVSNCEAGEYGLQQSGEGVQAVTPDHSTWTAPVQAENWSPFD